LQEEIKENSSENVPHVSAYTGDMNFMVSYINAGGPLSQRNANGDTILHAATDGWQYRMVEFLALSGSDVNAQNKQGDTPLHTIVRSRETPFEGEFLQRIANEDARRETFRILLHHGADLCIKNMQGANALHIAAHDGDLIAIEELLVGKRIKSIDTVTSKGVTALVLAIFQEHIACVKHLITLGPDLNFLLPSGNTPLTLLHKSENADLRAICDVIDINRKKHG
jgi:ankyrin repeat protein